MSRAPRPLRVIENQPSRGKELEVRDTNVHMDSRPGGGGEREGRPRAGGEDPLHPGGPERVLLALEEAKAAMEETREALSSRKLVAMVK